MSMAWHLYWGWGLECRVERGSKSLKCQDKDPGHYPQGTGATERWKYKRDLGDHGGQTGWDVTKGKEAGELR